jgi:aryl-alcohol dehydrogenase-like predicted oxidoreductase
MKDTDQLVFRQAFKSGVSYWDTADSYGWGGNEKAIGSYFGKFPGDRGKVFLVNKAAGSNAQELPDKLDTSLQRMNTSYIDRYLIHYVSDVSYARETAFVYCVGCKHICASARPTWASRPATYCAVPCPLKALFGYTE